MHLQVFLCDSEDNSSTLLHIDSPESLLKSQVRGSARPAAPAGPPSPCGAGRPGRPCSGAAPRASRRAVGDMPRVCRPRRSRARDSGKAQSAGRMGCTHTHAPRCTGTS